jgi:hypothetical protein
MTNTITPPSAANDNDRLLPDWMTPAEFWQYVRTRKKRLLRQLAADFQLRTSPEFRRDWEVTLGMEQCGLRQLSGQS